MDDAVALIFGSISGAALVVATALVARRCCGERIHRCCHPCCPTLADAFLGTAPSTSVSARVGYETIEHELDPEELEFKNIIEKTVAASKRFEMQLGNSAAQYSLDDDEDVESEQWTNATLAKLGLNQSGRLNESTPQSSSSASIINKTSAISLVIADESDSDSESSGPAVKPTSAVRLDPPPADVAAALSTPIQHDSNAASVTPSRASIQKLLAQYDDEEEDDDVPVPLSTLTPVRLLPNHDTEATSNASPVEDLP